MNRETSIPVAELVEELAPQRRFRPYPQYRDSGIEWHGGIPRDWETKRLRFAARINPVKSELRGVAPDAEVSFVPMEAVCEYGGLVLDQAKPLESVQQGYTYFRDGDIVVAKITPCFENGKGSIATDLTNGVGFGTTELHVLRPQAELDTSYLFYLTITHGFRKLGAAEMYGAGGQKRVPDDFLRDFRTPIPPLDEQRAIAAFLHRETARIDALIAKKQRLIELLQEKRRAVVDEVLITNRRPTWTSERLKFSSSFVTSGSRGWAEFYSDDGAVFIRIGNLTRDSIDLDLSDIQRVTPPAGTEGERTRARAGDVLVSVTAYIGSIAVVPPNLDEAYVNQHTALIRLKPDTLNPRLLAYSLFSRFGQQQFRASLYGGTKDGLSLVDVKDVSIIRPPRHEQDAIVAQLDAAMTQLTGIAATVNTAINRIREYRSALISAAVTGKIDVRNCGEAPPCQ